ncbi:MAG: diacylglycerol kinase family lipid kinase [Lachnospiraceae bacterium]|nr:diacylglycerol kinase family lipid kinase [Lachnospiraceae bacterium]
MIHFIVNPKGASGKTMRIWEKTEGMLKELDAEYQVHFSAPDNRIPQICRKLCEDTPDTVDIVVLGGDGSMNDAVNGITDFERVRLGLIPSGSGNDMVRDMGLPDLKELVERIAEQKTYRTADVGELLYYPAGRNDSAGPVRRLFNVSSGAGFDAAICVDVDRSKAKEIFNRLGIGKLIYLFVAVRQIFTMRPCKMTLEGNIRDVMTGREETYTEDRPLVFEKAMFAATMNHQYEGGGFQFCPDASAEDGMLDICLPDGLGVADFFKLFPKAAKGRHIGSEGIHILRTSRLRIRCSSPIWIHTDGEVCGESCDLTVGIAAGKLRLLV